MFGWGVNQTATQPARSSFFELYSHHIFEGFLVAKLRVWQVEIGRKSCFAKPCQSLNPNWHDLWKKCPSLAPPRVEFVTCGVELLRGHCTDIPADQGSWKRICAICSFWRLFTVIMTKSVEVFQFSFWKTKLLIFFFYFIKIKPPA